MSSEEHIHIPYYPGCTLKTKALGFERSAMDCARELGFEMNELKDWNCCGASFPLTDSNLMGLAGPTNVLIEAELHCEEHELDPRVITLCSFCYNTLKRTSHAFEKQPEKRTTLNAFLDREYKGTVKVEHYLEYLRDGLGFDKLAEMVKVDMSSFKVAPYYGCLLLKPGKEIGLDDPEEPTILHDFLDALGCTLVDFPGQIDCCGSYLVMREPEKAKALSSGIVDEADEYGAETIVTACPLCHSNLDKCQAAGEGEGVPILYFTQLLAIALGLSTEEHKFEDHHIDPLAVITSCGAFDAAAKKSA
ncbi:MAG: CoB--CoM heterodisulfide reductase iron-sulfur subunit B family protein [Sedimenticola sp.]